MTVRDALSIAIPALALLIALTAPGEPRWTRRPSVITGQPRRRALATAFAVLLITATVHAIT